MIRICVSLVLILALSSCSSPATAADQALTIKVPGGKAVSALPAGPPAQFVVDATKPFSPPANLP